MGLFITFEGPEGSGKTTQIKLLADALMAQGLDIVLTREPGGTAIGDAIRSILLDLKSAEMRAKTETFLFNAARAQLVGQVIQPALEQGQTVLCDRYADSTLAYQGYGRQQELGELRAMCDYATGGLVPDLTIYLDVDAQKGLDRKAAGDGEEWNRMEAQSLDFHRAVRQGFLALAANEPSRWLIIDASQEVQTVKAEAWRRVSFLLENEIGKDKLTPDALNAPSIAAAPNQPPTLADVQEKSQNKVTL